MKWTPPPPPNTPEKALKLTGPDGPALDSVDSSTAPPDSSVTNMPDSTRAPLVTPIPRVFRVTPWMKRLLVGTGAIAIVVGTAVVWHQRVHTAPDEAELQAVLMKRLEQLPTAELWEHHIVETRIEQDARDVRIPFTAHRRLREALFEPIPASECLDGRPVVAETTIRRAREALLGVERARVLQLAGLSEYTEPKINLPCIKTTMPSGQSQMLHGVLRANRTRGQWEFGALVLDEDPLPAKGRPRSSFPSAVLIVDSAEDRLKLVTLRDEFEATATRLQEAGTRYRSEIDALWRERQRQIFNALAPASVLAGSLVLRGETNAVTLEVTQLDEANATLQGVFRNDGGWTLTRPCLGTLVFDQAAGTVRLNLQLAGGTAAALAGPLLGVEGDHLLACSYSGGEFQGDTSLGRLSLRPLIREAAAAAMQALIAAESLVREAARAGRTYRILTHPDKSAAEALLLTFADKPGAPGMVTARMAVAGREEQGRPFDVEILLHRYQSGNWPVQLRSAADQAAVGSPELLGQPTAQAIRLVPEGQQLRGEANGREIRLEPVSEEFLGQVAAQREALRQSLISSLAAGTVHVGTLVGPPGNLPEKVLVRFDGLDSEGRQLSATIESIDIPGLSRRATGVLNWLDRHLDLRLEPGRREPTGSLQSPVFAMEQPCDLRLTINAETISGVLADSGWNVQISRSRPAAAKAESDFRIPSERGCYLAVDGKWVALPSNGFKVNKSLIGNLLGPLTPPVAEGNRPDKLAEVVLAGNSPVPKADRRRAVVAYVGNIAPQDPRVLSHAPDYPILEIKKLQTGNDGRRTADLVQVAAGVAGFGDTRTPATVLPLDPTHTLILCTPGLRAGRYVVAVNLEGYEFEVHD